MEGENDLLAPPTDDEKALLAPPTAEEKGEQDLLAPPTEDEQALLAPPSKEEAVAAGIKPFSLEENDKNPIQKGIEWLSEKFGHKGPDLPKPTSEDIMKREQMVDEMVTSFVEPMERTAEAVLSPLQRPAQFVAQASARANSVLDVATLPEPSIGKALDAFLNPESLMQFRVKRGYPSRIQEIMAMPGMTWQEKLNVIGNEITPTGLFMSDLLQESDEQMVRELFPKGWGDFGLMASKFGVDVMSDPLTHSKIGSRITPKAREFTAATFESLQQEKALEEGIRKGTIALGADGAAIDASAEIERLRKARLAGASRTGFGVETEDGKRALYQFVLPGSDVPLFTVKGQRMMQGFDEIGAALEASIPGFRKVTQRSPHEAFNVAVGMSELEQAVQADYIDRAHSLILSTGAPNEKIIRHASNLLEHGPEAGEALSRKMGIRLTPDELEQSRQYSIALQKVNEYGNEYLAQITGKNIGAAEAYKLSPKEQQAIIARLKKVYGDIPAVLVQDGDRTFDLTFPQNGGAYDMGRALTEDARKARKAQLALDDFNKSTKSAGYATVPDSFREREELSTQMMNSIFKNKYGIDEAFNPNKTEVVLNNLQNKLEAGRKLKLYKTTKELYGLQFGEIKDFIKRAEDRVQFATEKGVAPSYEDLVTMRMTPNDFRPINNKLFNEIAPFYDVNDTKFFGEKELYYPKSVADRIETMWSQPSRNKILQEIAAWQKIKTKNMLTSVFRLGKQSVENIIKARQAGIPWSDLITEMRMGLPGVEKDAIAKLADNLPSVSETVFDLNEFKGKIKLTAAMAADPEVNAGVDAFYGTLHEAAKAGTLDKVLGVGESTAAKVAKAPYRAVKNVAEFMNDNKLSRSIRHIGNFSDGVTKRAYFRKLMNEGYGPLESARMVGDHFMDFTSTTNDVRAMRYVLPFASFQFKNLETLPRLMAQSPGITNATNPFNGAFKRAYEDYNGWSPDDWRSLNKSIPYYRHPILGPVLRGQKTLLAFQDKALDFLNQYAAAGLGKEDKDRLSTGFQFSLQIPTNLEAGLQMIDPSRANENFSSPLVAAAAIWMLGVDPFTGKPLESVEAGNNNMIASDKLVRSLRALNPIDYPKFYNKMVMPVMEKLIPRFKERLEEGPISRRMAEVLRLELGTDAPLKKLKLSDETIRTMTNMKFFGMGNLDKADDTFHKHQMMLFRSLDKMEMLADRKYSTQGKQELLRTLGSMKAIIQEINQNTKIYNDYRFRANKNFGTSMDPLTQKGKEMELEYGEPMSDNPLEDALKPVPATPVPDALDDEDLSGDQSRIVDRKQDRMPAGVPEDVKKIFDFGFPPKVVEQGPQGLYQYMYSKAQERAYKIFEKDIARHPEVKTAIDRYIKNYMNPDRLGPMVSPGAIEKQETNDLMNKGIVARDLASVGEEGSMFDKASQLTSKEMKRPAIFNRASRALENHLMAPPSPEEREMAEPPAQGKGVGAVLGEDNLFMQEADNSVDLANMSPGEKAKAQRAFEIMDQIDAMTGKARLEEIDERKLADLNAQLFRLEDELGASVVYNEDEDDYVLIKGKINMDEEGK